jgi:uncharacterized protein YggE
MRHIIPDRRWLFTTIGPLALAGIAGVALSACTNSGASAATPTPACGSTAPKLTVQASGQATATPNLLTLDIGVDVSDPTASAALTEANDKATALSNTLQLAGVAKADIQTTNFSIQPNFATNGTITGYQVANTIVVKLHNLSASGAVIDAAASSAGNAIRVNGLTFSVDDTTTVDGTARADGIGVAAAHARSMATAAGESINGVCSITDSTTNYPITNSLDQGSAGMAAGGATASVPVQPGTQQSTAQVTVVYALDPSTTSHKG